MYSSKKNRNNKKIRVVSFGASVDHNFGGPCLLAGLSHLLDNNYFESLVHYQSNKPCEKSYEYIKFQLDAIRKGIRSDDGQAFRRLNRKNFG
jgi:hypothetical protein